MGCIVPCMKSEEQWIEEYMTVLEGVFERYVGEFGKDEPVGVLVSGGIDSSIIAWIAWWQFKHVSFFCLDSEKGVDKPYVELLMKNLGSQVTFVQFRQKDVVEIRAEIGEILRMVGVETNIMQISLASGFYLLARRISEAGIRKIFTGQGPDILFGGYSKYKTVNTNVLKSEIQKDLPLLEIDGKRDGAMGALWGVSFVNPYLEKVFVDFALSVPVNLLIHRGIGKFISRVAGKKMGLPKEICERPKKAFQYSTGIQKLSLR